MASALISVLTPVFNPDPDVLDAAIASVAAQSYPRWQLCLADDASTRAGVHEVLARWTRRDARIQVHYSTANGGISAASNQALAMARGEFVALLDHDDLLHPDALAAVNHVVANDHLADVIYTDEDKLDESGAHVEPFYKPGWSPDYLTGCMYLGHLATYRTSLVLAVGAFREGYEGSQDWDLALRATERARRVVHIPQVLYHWRISPQSVASATSAKPYAVDAARRSLVDHLARQGASGAPEPTIVPGWFQLRRSVTGDPLVSVLLPTAGGRRLGPDGTPEVLVERCVRSLVEATGYHNIEIICMISPGENALLEQQLTDIAGDRIRFHRTTGPFNFSATINAAAIRALGPVLLLLNDDTEVLHPDWLDRMLETCEDPRVGAVGAKLLYPDDSIQHAGVTHNAGGAPTHPGAGEHGRVGYFGRFLLPMTYLAVTGACLLTPTEKFWQVGGLDPALPLNYNDIDYCLKLGAAGYRVVQQNAAVLRHYESATRPPTVTYQEVHEFVTRWGHLTCADPFTRPQLNEAG